MITKLRRKFIRLTMLSVVSVLLLLVVTINLVFYAQNKRRQEEAFARIYEMITNSPEFSFDAADTENGRAEPGLDNGREKAGHDLPFATGFTIVYLDNEKTITEIDTDKAPFIETDLAEEYAEAAIDSGKIEGWSGKQIFRLYEREEGFVLILMDGRGMTSSILSVLVITVGVVFICCLLVFILVVLFSGRAIHPLAESYEKQKQFITNAGHELKTPLTVISANTEIARMSLGECEWFDGIDKQTEKMQELVKQLISLTKMDEENTEFLKESFCLSDAVYDTAMSYKGLVESQGKQLTVDTARDIMYIGDEAKIRQLIAILFDNAVKYSDEKGSIAVNLISGRHVLLKVTNTFEQAETLLTDRLFDRFYRDDSSRSATGGYGLGLSIAKAIVDRHGGSIRAYPDGQQQIVFEVKLRAADK